MQEAVFDPLSSSELLDVVSLRNAAESIAGGEIEQAFPGSVLTHILTVASDERHAVAIAGLHAIEAMGARLEGLNLSRFGGSLSHRFKITSLGTRAARLLCDRLADLPGVTRASVEHQILRKM
jgi:hypothetical protein